MSYFALTLDESPEGLIKTALANLNLHTQNKIADDPNGYLLDFVRNDLEKALARMRYERDTAEVHITYDRKKA